MNHTKVLSPDLKPAKSPSVIVIEILEHSPGMAPVKTVVRKTNQNVSTSRFSSDDVFNEHIAKEEILMHLAAGYARILIDGNIHLLNAGDSLKVPANSSRQISEGIGFTLISTDIKGLSI